MVMTGTTAGSRRPPAPRIARLGPDDFADLLELDRWAFPAVPGPDAEHDQTVFDRMEWDRTTGAYLPGAGGAEELAGISSVYSLNVPVPGGAVSGAGLTWVGVHPLHRRRGALTALIGDHLRAVRERGEPISVLTASEATIYGRFGYGIGAHYVTADLPRGSALRPVAGAEDVRFRLERVDVDRHADLVGDCYEAARRHRPGMVSRNTRAHRRGQVSDSPLIRGGGENLRILIAEADDDGPARGYALFRRTDTGGNGRPSGEVRIRELVARDPAATQALWSRLLDLDLTTTVVLDKRPVDDPLFQLLVDPRAGRVQRGDQLWVRLVDLPAALAARRYSADLDVVIQVRDDLCPGNAGRWRLTGGPDRAACVPTTDAPAFALDVRELGAAYLGSVSLTALADAGLLTGTDPQAVAAAAHAFTWPVAAHCGWTF